MEAFFQKIFGLTTQNNKENKKQSGVLQKIYDVQVELLDVMEDELAFQRQEAKRAAQAQKRKSADTIFKSNERKKEAQKKKEGGLLSKILGGLGKALGSILSSGGLMKAILGALGLGAGKSLFDMLMERLFPKNRQGQSLLSRIMERLFGRGKKGAQKGIITQLFDDLFGKKGKIRTMFTNLFGKNGFIANKVRELFKPDGKLRAGLKKVTGLFDDLGKSIKKLLKFLPGFGDDAASVAFRGGISGFFNKVLGKTGLGKLVRGGAISGLIEAVTTYRETQSITQSVAEGGGAFGGAVAGGKAGAVAGGAIGSAFGGVGAAPGALIGGLIGTIAGAFTGAKVGEAIYKAVKENTPFAPILDYIDGFFKGALGEIIATAQSFADMINVLTKAVSRFVSDTWDSFTTNVEKVVNFIKEKTEPVIEGITNFIKDDVEPVLIEIEKFLKPIVDPIKKLATKIIDPLISGLEKLGETIKNVIEFFKLPDAGDLGRGFVSGVTGGAKNFFTGIADAFRNYAEGRQTGGFVGTVPNQGGNGDRFPAMLQSGSVVLNQRASGYQRGGLIPTMLEQGEMVFGPRDPNAGAALMMNSMIPRFQEGGIASWNPFQRKTYTYNLPEGYTIDSVEAYGKKIELNKELTDVQRLARGLPAKDPTPTQGALLAKKEGDKVKAKKGGLTPTGKKLEKSGDISPGGYIDFIGDGSGFTGELKFTDGAGKAVGSWGGISGVARNAGTSQSQRMNVGGTLNPLPDGSYPIENPMGPGSGAVGNWAAWINNPSGNIGNRGQIFMHNDIGNNGTAGCIGVMTDGVRGSEASMAYKSFYDQVMPKKVNVNLQSNKGKKFAVGELGTMGDTGTSSAMATMFSPSSGKSKPGMFPGIEAIGGEFGESLRAILGSLGEVLGPVLGALGGLTGSLIQGASNMLDGVLGVDQSGAQAGSVSEVQGEASGDMKTGRDLIMQTGVPKKGANYLAGNIQQESSWNGQRDWGQVLGDGTSRNGGLVSWASWSDDPARLGKIEGYLGKNIKNASDGEQINAMMWEMKNDYPSAYKTFMNPNASDAELRKASKAYWGYGEEGQRYQYAKQLEGMQKGGVAQMKGTSSLSTSMMKKSQEAFAQKIAEAMTPIVVPVPMGGGGGQQVTSAPGNNTGFPQLPSEDNSIMGMEYKYRITMGASV